MLKMSSVAAADAGEGKQRAQMRKECMSWIGEHQFGH